MRREAEEAARKLEEERKRVQAQLEREAAELRAKVDAGLSFVGGLLDVHMWVSENIILYIYTFPLQQLIAIFSPRRTFWKSFEIRPKH